MFLRVQDEAVKRAPNNIFARTHHLKLLDQDIRSGATATAVEALLALDPHRFAFKMMNSLSKTVNFAFKMMHFTAS